MASPTAPASPAPRFRRLDRDQRRGQILAAARRLFRGRHYSAVSTTEIAAAAGVTRGLLHHYFGTKRQLYLEVVRELVRLPPPPLPEEIEGRPREEVLAQSVEAWLELVRRNRRTWLAAIGARGIGRDPELEAILDEASEAYAERVIEVLGIDGDGAGEPELRAVIRAYGGMAQEATREWLERRRLSREQVRVLLTDTLLEMVREVLPRIAGRAGGAIGGGDG